MLANLKTQQWPLDWKMSLFILITKKGNAKECSNYDTIVLILHPSKVMQKIFQARLQNQELPDGQVGFRKGKGTRDQITNIAGSQKMQGNFRKTATSASLTMLKTLCGSQQTVDNS